MTEIQRLFLVQACTDFATFEFLRKQAKLPPCHALYCLQMATELLGKAHAWRHGPVKKSHRALVPFLRSLVTNRKAQRRLGYERRNENWENLIRKSVPIAERVEKLAPSLANDSPNPEYPWPSDKPHTAPAEYDFEIWRELLETSTGRQFIHLIKGLFQSADAFL